MTFWDSSAVLPLLAAEAPSAACAALLDTGLVVWTLTPVEIASALRRKEREGALTAAGVATALQRLDELRAYWHEVTSLERVMSRAMRLLAVHPLRAADALQLAAALTFCDEDTRGARFVTLDLRLREAARREGFDVPAPEAS